MTEQFGDFTDGRKRRCINLDWLEVDCLEPADGVIRDADYFSNLGIGVEVRDYGTRVYAQMFTIFGTDGLPLLEIRREPKTTVLPVGDCHIRLVNRTCYFDDAVEQLSNFLSTHHYIFNSIYRVDICLDFELFDSGDVPNKFIQRYLSRVYSKINQSNLTAHGADTWTGRDWNSLSWGAPTSDIGTKLYNKTLELYDPTTDSYKKPYIRQAWASCGLVSDWQRVKRYGTNPANKKEEYYTPQIWRLEFSIRSSVKKWFAIELDGHSKNYQSIRNTLECYDDRAKLLTIFASLAQHYFRFKYYQDGVRKDRCDDKRLFDFRDIQLTYKVGRDSVATSERVDRSLVRLISLLREQRETTFDQKIKDACTILIDMLQSKELAREMALPWRKIDAKAWQLALRERLNGNTSDPAMLIEEFKRILHINDSTLPPIF